MAESLHFQDIIGQKEAIAHLQNALRTGEISHAYIISGEKGSGRRELAAAFAATLQCTDRQEADGLLEPCGHCHSCLQSQTLNQPDIITVLPQKENKSGALQVDDARRLRDDVQIKPYSSEWKVYIVPNADRMNVQAQNALLKTLEEPPAYAVILLLAEGTEGFPPTVLSRCITLRLHPVEESLITIELEQSGISHESAILAARLSHGNPGRAKRMAEDEEFLAFREQAVNLLKKVPVTDTYTFLQAAGTFTGEKFDAFIDLGESWLRDLLMVKSTGRVDNLIFQDESVYIKNAADILSFAQLQAAADAFDLAHRRRNANGNDTQILEMLLLSLRSSWRTLRKVISSES